MARWRDAVTPRWRNTWGSFWSPFFGASKTVLRWAQLLGLKALLNIQRTIVTSKCYYF
jgi:hypothetical protein